METLSAKDVNNAIKVIQKFCGKKNCFDCEFLDDEFCCQLQRFPVNWPLLSETKIEEE